MGEQSDVPDYFVCPITLEMMRDPVISKCGHMFDKEAIYKWLKGEYDPSRKTLSRACPVCHTELDDSSLSPCYPIKTAIEDFLAAGKEHAKASSDTGARPSPMMVRLKEKLRFYRRPQRRQLGWESELIGDGLVGATGCSATAPMTRQYGTPPLRQPPTEADFNPVMPLPVIEVWARLHPVVFFHQPIELNREKFLVGRHATCHGRITLSEISSRHCYIWRVRSADGGCWEVFIEDRSTNGTYVNGRNLGKGMRRQVFEGDEIALGRRLAGRRDVNDVKSYLDWVFIGTSALSNCPEQVEHAKSVIPSFGRLVEMTNEELESIGVSDMSVRRTILAAVETWKHDHRFPGYQLRFTEPHLYMKNPNLALEFNSDDLRSESIMDAADDATAEAVRAEAAQVATSQRELHPGQATDQGSPSHQEQAAMVRQVANWRPQEVSSLRETADSVARIGRLDDSGNSKLENNGSVGCHGPDCSPGSDGNVQNLLSNSEPRLGAVQASTGGHFGASTTRSQSRPGVGSQPLSTTLGSTTPAVEAQCSAAATSNANDVESLGRTKEPPVADRRQDGPAPDEGTRGVGTGSEGRTINEICSHASRVGDASCRRKSNEDGKGFVIRGQKLGVGKAIHHTRGSTRSMRSEFTTDVNMPQHDWESDVTHGNAKTEPQTPSGDLSPSLSSPKATNRPSLGKYRPSDSPAAMAAGIRANSGMYERNLYSKLQTRFPRVDDIVFRTVVNYEKLGAGHEPSPFSAGIRCPKPCLDHARPMPSTSSSRSDFRGDGRASHSRTKSPGGDAQQVHTPDRVLDEEQAGPRAQPSTLMVAADKRPSVRGGSALGECDARSLRSPVHEPTSPKENVRPASRVGLGRVITYEDWLSLEERVIRKVQQFAASL